MFRCAKIDTSGEKSRIFQTNQRRPTILHKVKLMQENVFKTKMKYCLILNGSSWPYLRRTSQRF